MQTIPQEQVIKRFQVLPDALKDAIFSQKTIDATLRYCALRDIPENKIHFVGQLTTDVLLGYLRPETFAFEIQKETGVDALKATQVAHDIDTEIFSAVRLELKKLYPPTIQTPTVQAQGFVRSQPVAAEPPKPAPRYVVQIPERFKKPEAHSEAVQSVPIPTPITAQEPAAPTASPATQPSKIQVPSFKIQEPASPPMDPVVPLPTFIQSKFKASELGAEAGIKQQPVAPVAQPTNDALKNAFGKFTTSSTATGVVQEPVSPYRETVEEQKPVAKVQGKVIDLSQF